MLTSKTPHLSHDTTSPLKIKSLLSGKGKFNVFRRCTSACEHTPYNRRDYYKITLIVGEGNLQYADRGVQVDRPALLLSNPVMPYSWEPTSSRQDGYFCVFSEDF